MKILRQWLLGGLALSTAFYGNFAYSRIETGLDLLQQCAPVKKFIDNPNAVRSQREQFDAGVCVGYVEGVYDSMVMSDDICPKSRPSSSTQMARIVMEHAKNDLSLLDTYRVAIVGAAFLEAFPCADSAR